MFCNYFVSVFNTPNNMILYWIYISTTMSHFYILSPHNYDNICTLQNLVFSMYYSVFLFNICMSIHLMTKVKGVLDILHKYVLSTQNPIQSFIYIYITVRFSSFFLLPLTWCNSTLLFYDTLMSQLLYRCTLPYQSDWFCKLYL